MFKVIILVAIIVSIAFYFNHFVGYCLLGSFLVGLASWSRYKV